jgi:hypothetical protein
MKKLEGTYKIRLSRWGIRFTINLYKKFWVFWIWQEWICSTDREWLLEDLLELQNTYNIVQIEDKYEILKEDNID